MKNKNTNKVWEEIWKRYYKQIDELVKKCDSRVNKALEFAQDNFKILDAGCGLGQVVFNLLKKGYDSYGVDYNTNTIRLARKIAEMKYMGKERFINGDLLNLPFANNCFDMYLSYGVIEHYKKEEHLRIIKEACRIVKNNGIIYLYYPNIWSPFGIQSYVFSKLGRRRIWQLPLSLSYVKHLMAKFKVKLVQNYSCEFSKGLDRFILEKLYLSFLPNPLYLVKDKIMNLVYSNENKWAKYGHINITVGINQK